MESSSFMKAYILVCCRVRLGGYYGEWVWLITRISLPVSTPGVIKGNYRQLSLSLVILLSSSWMNRHQVGSHLLRFHSLASSGAFLSIFPPNNSARMDNSQFDNTRWAKSVLPAGMFLAEGNSQMDSYPRRGKRNSSSTGQKRVDYSNASTNTPRCLAGIMPEHCL